MKCDRKRDKQMDRQTAQKWSLYVGLPMQVIHKLIWFLFRIKTLLFSNNNATLKFRANFQPQSLWKLFLPLKHYQATCPANKLFSLGPNHTPGNVALSEPVFKMTKQENSLQNNTTWDMVSFLTATLTDSLFMLCHLWTGIQRA